MKKIIVVLLTLLLVLLPMTALAAADAQVASPAVDWVTIAAYAEAAVVLVFGFMVSYFKTSSVFRGFVAQLIADAEVKYANVSKAGEIKMGYVINKLYEFVPLPLKMVFTRERIEAFAQDVFDEITKYAVIQCDKAVAALQEKYNASKKP
jgi:hypothetical protein